jgi:adenine-specific DNA-methyltransferase
MDTLSKFQSLLFELFQFEASDLDFGIYRILNHKRDQIYKFIKEDIKNVVENTFSKHKDERLLNITQKFEDARKRVIETLGEIAFTATGDLKAEFQDTHVGKDYLVLKEQKDLAGKIDEIKLQVFNDLYTFFSRYYEEGDFVPQYRYSIRNFRYAIPYNGEEVKLHWANEGQYYTKTGILFRDYAFFSDPGKTYKIIFRTVSAREELSSNKATKARFFVLDDENNPSSPPFSKGGQGGFPDEKTLVIRFQYRELIDKEVKLFDVEGGSNTAKQEKINQKIFDEIIKQIKETTLKGFLSSEYKTEKPLLLYQISRFTAKNTRDYFIHKNLRKFLTEQLDYFIKAEVLSIETLENEPFLDKHITRAKVVREVGEKIIDFLSQIEDFQKKLWEKKKFVLKTEYVITTDRIPEEFYAEILKNKDQIKEWKELGFIEDVIPAKAGIQNKKLPTDTKHFNEEFKEKLLEKLTENGDLDDLLDGLLIKSENWQALNLLFEKYKKKVPCIYIDPPYNTGDDGFLYRDTYQHSSWLSLVSDRIILGAQFLPDNGTIFVSIDDIEAYNLRIILNSICGEGNFIDTIIWKKRYGGGAKEKYLVSLHEYILFYARDKLFLDSIFIPLDSSSIERYYKFRDEKFETRGPYRIHPLEATKSVGIRPNLVYPIPCPDGSEVLPERQWWWDKKRVMEALSRNELEFIRGKKGWVVHTKQYLKDENGVGRQAKPFSIIDDIFTQHGTAEIGALFSDSKLYAFPKPSALILRLLKLVSIERGQFIVDYFAGSGPTAHAVMRLNSEDGNGRKFILVEMASYFDTIITPRIKKVAYTFNWKDGKPQDSNGIGTFFKYQILEQYEDTLDNLELKPNENVQKLFKGDYLLKYFLEFETQDSPNFLNIENLKDPFSYKLKVNFEEVGEPEEAVVDIPETFNYLLGLKVKKIKAREIATAPTRNDRGGAVRSDKRRKYLFILGEKEGINIAVVWRKVDDNWDENDFRKDKEFIAKELKTWMPQRIYINGQSVLTTNLEGHPVEVHYIEPEFKTLMFS